MLIKIKQCKYTIILLLLPLGVELSKGLATVVYAWPGSWLIPLHSQPRQRSPHIVLPSHSSPAPGSSDSNSCLIQLFWKLISFHPLNVSKPSVPTGDVG